MPVDSPPAPQPPLVLDSLANPGLPSDECPRRARIQIDLLLLAIEALDLGGGEAMLGTVRDLGLEGLVKGRVHLWLLRGTNPMRRYSQRRPLDIEEAKALVIIICTLARRLTVVVRQLLVGYQQLADKQLSPEHHFRLADYLSRFRSHFRARMNPRRAGVIAYSSDEKLDELALELLQELLLCAGVLGPQRLWNSLFDGEVS
ncbi:DUF3038 domain-containing protein [Phormidium tenue]|uniref:DUF3038 domain-containing protein n=1 Tax=Phormidium tenue NIES-30 TaxID=549789 RepID=A0A1U7J7E7_9CYAN|nr:DUF3038 domain-containing protein [Phormidium tenue]MBD2231568.1 DUF3038 domain-containing protein [Phormidium tenue FACHB-1052]OKH49050.1 hypothetical protein NIES30_07710 [Phormidium tenue NIES-30]